MIGHTSKPTRYDPSRKSGYEHREPIFVWQCDRKLTKAINRLEVVEKTEAPTEKAGENIGIWLESIGRAEGGQRGMEPREY